MKEHHLPEFIQSAWSAPNADRQLLRYPLNPSNHSMRPLRRAPGAFGYLHDYTAFTEPLPHGVDDKNAFEKATQRLDSDAAVVRDKMLIGAEVTAEDYATWARFLMFMRIREPELIAYARAEATKVLLQKLAEAPDEYDAAVHGKEAPPTMEAWVREVRPGLIENAMLYILPDILNSDETHQRFFRMPFWVADFSTTGGKLLLGDRPMMMVGDLASDDVIVCMPLSPCKVFVSSPSAAFRERMGKSDRSEFLRRINEETLNRARDYVFADDASNEAIIAETVRRRRDRAA